MSDFFCIPKLDVAQFPDVGGLRCITIYVPDSIEYVHLLAGMYERLTNDNAWVGDDAAIAVRTALLLNAYDYTDWAQCLMNEYKFSDRRIFPPLYASASPNAVGFAAVTGADSGGVWRMNPAGINDTITWRVYLIPGDYIIAVRYSKSVNTGKVKFYFDGEEQLDFDTYAASSTPNQNINTPTFTVTAAGYYDVSSVVYGKNASSSNYFFFMQYFDLRRFED